MSRANRSRVDELRERLASLRVKLSTQSPAERERAEQVRASMLEILSRGARTPEAREYAARRADETAAAMSPAKAVLLIAQEIDVAVADAESLDEQAMAKVERRLRGLERAALRSAETRGGPRVSVEIRPVGPRQDAHGWWVRTLFAMYRRWAELDDNAVVVSDDQLTDGLDAPTIRFEIRGDFVSGLLWREHGLHRARRIRTDTLGELEQEIDARVLVLAPMAIAFQPSAPGSIAVSRSGRVDLPSADVELVMVERPGASEDRRWPKGRYYRVRHRETGWLTAGEGMDALAYLRAMLASRDRVEADPTIVREYAIAPTPRVRDHRTGRETRDVEGVLAGGIDDFLES